jgi:hypothetical protein
MENNKSVPTALCLIGIVFVIYSFQYKIGTITNPKDGFFPIVIASALVCLSLLLLGRNWYFCKKNRNLCFHQELPKEPINVKKIFALIAVLVLFALLHTILGYWVSVFFAMVALQRIAGVSSWKWSLFGGIVTTIVGYMVFEYYMGAFFPKGFMGL